jgi:prepilin peptidase CpaA
MKGQLCIAMLIGVVASLEDLTRRAISNWIPAAALAAGLMWLTFFHGWRGALSSIAGAAVGFVLFFVVYWLGGRGGGDVKLMAGLGAVVGVERVVAAALWTSVLGAMLALAVIGIGAFRRRFARWAASGEPKAIPYAPAIALGALLALIAST